MDRTPVPSPAETERSLRAAELALGLVEGEDREEAARRDPALAREVARWEEDLARFTDELEPAPPSPRAWQALSATIAREAETAPWPRPEPGRAARWRDRLDSVRLWRGLAGGALATAAALALTLLVRSPASVPGAVAPSSRVLLVSALLPRDGTPLYIATYDAARAVVLAVPAATAPTPGRAPQLWLVPKDTGEPIALGVLNPEAAVAVALSPEAAKLIDREAGLVVTLEPAGAAVGPSAQGPVIAHGRFTEL